MWLLKNPQEKDLVLTFSTESDPPEEAGDLSGDVGLSSSRETHQHDAEVGEDGRGTVGHCSRRSRHDRNVHAIDNLEQKFVFPQTTIDCKGRSQLVCILNAFVGVYNIKSHE